MNRKLLTVLCIFAFVIMPLFAGAPRSVYAQEGTEGSPAMPANPEKIAQMLIKQGVIKPNATAEQKDAAVQAYLQKKAGGGAADKAYNPMARKQVEANEAALNAAAGSDLRGRKLGNKPAPVANSDPQFKTTKGADKLLLILVDFSAEPYTWTPKVGPERTAAGPLHNQIPTPAPDNFYDLWVPDFSTQHYEDMLFTPGGWTMPKDAPHYAGNHYGSMHDYYLAQSFGQYTVDGDAYGWFTVDKPEAYYGDDNPVSGNDNLAPGTTGNLIADAVDVINKQKSIDWAAYDTDSDCVIDHPLFIHAGMDQSGGGGTQGDDAIWAHSSSVDQQVATTDVCPGGLFIKNYTIMPEDGGVGVFAHEFGHDLGLPDEYDTVYSGRGDDVAFWSLMSSGSWVGKPAQTQPSNISIWGRAVLGWVKAGDNMAVLNINDLGKTPMNFRLENAERWGGTGTINAIRVNLPNKIKVYNTPHSGAGEWWAGQGDEIDRTLDQVVDLTGKTSASLSFWTMYDTEENWDFAFVQVSTDNGTTWKSLEMPGTTSDLVDEGHPLIRKNLPGFTGNSGGWVQKTADLSPYAGKQIMVRFRYITDWGTSLNGFFVDDITVTADGAVVFTDDAETKNPAWVTGGWTWFAGWESKAHYYMMEWRNLNSMETPLDGAHIVNFDNGLTNVYSHDPYSTHPDEPWYFSYNPGMLLWYRDTSYTDNWTGIHPGHGYLLIVDAHQQAMFRAPYPKNGSLPWNSRVQTYDSPFSLNKAYDATLSYWGIEKFYTGLNAVPNFDDSKSYYDRRASANSVITPTYGLIFRVLGQAADNSAALIGLGTK